MVDHISSEQGIRTIATGSSRPIVYCDRGEDPVTEYSCRDSIVDCKSREQFQPRPPVVLIEQFIIVKGKAEVAKAI